MVNIHLHSEYPCTQTVIPNQFIDDFMPEANGEFVKVYLYLLRCIHSHAYNCTISAIADKLNNTEMDVARALRYWQRVGLLALEENPNQEICGISLLPMPKDNRAPVVPPAESKTITATVDVSLAQPPKTAAEAPKPSAPARQTPEKHRYTPEEMTAFQKDESISELFFIAETYMKHPLSENDMNTILYWHEALHFSTELIVYLLEYCISKGHSSIRYMDKVALGWHEKDITTVEAARDEAAIHSQVYYGVMKALGINGRSLVDAETALIRKWTKDYAFDLPIIQEACRRTIAATHQPSFEYTDSILTSWYNSHVHTLEDIKVLDEAYSKERKVSVKTSEAPSRKNNFNNFSSREYDYDNLEELLLSSSVHS